MLFIQTFLCTSIMFFSIHLCNQLDQIIQRFAFNTSHISYMIFFFYCCSVLESSESLSWRYRKLSLQSKMNILENGLFFFFMATFCNTCIFFILVSRMPLSPRVTKLEGRRGVIFLQPAPRVSASSSPRMKPHV